MIINILNMLNIGLVSTDVVERSASGVEHPNLRDHGILR